VLGVVAERLNRVIEHGQAEESLRKSEENFRRSLDDSPLGVRIVGPTKGETLYANQAILDIYGYSSVEELRTIPAEKRLTPESYAERMIRVEKWGQGEYSPSQYEESIVRKDGEIRRLQVFRKEILWNSARRIQVIYHDITERKQMERELRERNEQLDAQNEELQSQTEELMKQQQELIEKTGEVERTNQLKSEFLANMSHGLRTPLNVIIGFSELVRDEVPGKLNDEQRQCLDDIQSSGKHLLDLINEVLDLSRIESGKTELRLTSLALAEVAESLTRTMVPILASRKQSLDIEVEEGLPLVHADKAKLNEVLLNLLSNATKSTPDGGKLKIEAVREDN